MLGDDFNQDETHDYGGLPKLRLNLETGSFAYFAPAAKLYRAHGFSDCQPFGDYKPDPNNLFLTLDLRR